MENQEVFNIVSNIDGVVTIIHKDGLNAKAPNPIKIDGNIDSALNWLERRTIQTNFDLSIANIPGNNVEQRKAHVLIDRDKMTVSLVFNETDPFLKGHVTGKLEKHPDFLKWKINTGECWGHKALSEFIKMNRSCFSDKEIAMKLSSELANVKIKAETEIEKADDNKGNFRQLVAQRVIASNVPADFKLNMPVFKGQKKVEIEVEVYVSASDYSVTLVSAEANDIISDVRDTIIDDQKKDIQTIAPELVIIEQ